ncbi:hypothetical protein [Rhodopirellula sp. MGV]|uniref:hypothetical protein n=1 Tax=Rhodopirellula sp. MGV TaxID=2023130 RepID=UPI000B9715DC|nr:hypothetical protein [Rhodopirellula sp. MGV]OYP37027.1 hypothetical protein CGZ80_06655 [Rhodopirellula sp. MGV]
MEKPEPKINSVADDQCHKLAGLRSGVSCSDKFSEFAILISEPHHRKKSIPLGLSVGEFRQVSIPATNKSNLRNVEERRSELCLVPPYTFVGSTNEAMTKYTRQQQHVKTILENRAPQGGEWQFTLALKSAYSVLSV